MTDDVTTITVAKN